MKAFMDSPPATCGNIRILYTLFISFFGIIRQAGRTGFGLLGEVDFEQQAGELVGVVALLFKLALVGRRVLPEDLPALFQRQPALAADVHSAGSGRLRKEVVAPAQTSSTVPVAP